MEPEAAMTNSLVGRHATSGVETFELDASVSGGEAPIQFNGMAVTLLLPHGYLLVERLSALSALLYTLTLQNA